MRKLVFAINMTADGYCDHTLLNPDEEVHEYFARQMNEAGALLYGRTTFELMFPYWSDVLENPAGQSPADLSFARAITSVPQLVVVSKTIEQSKAGRAKIIRASLRDEVMKLKHEDGKQISTGGITLASELLSLGLIDDVRLIVHPVLAGGGRRLFEQANFAQAFNLRLVKTSTFRSGAIEICYETVRST